MALVVQDAGRIRITALVPYQPDTAPSQRFRIEQWMPWLAEAGVDVELHPFAGPELAALLQQSGRTLRKTVLTLAGFARTARTAASLPRDRIVLVHRAACLAGPPIVERMLRARRNPLLYDFDDAIFKLHTSASNRAAAWLKQPGKTATICQISDHVVVGNSYLADWARRHNPCVSIIPTSIDTDRCRPRASSQAGGQIIVGWTGSSTSQTYLEAFTPMLRNLVAARDIELRVLSTRQPLLPGVPHTWRPWSPATEASEVAAFDIGIMPMPDEEWALGKCALKALQYMAAAVPPVASAIGANREVIEHGRNGLLVSTTQEWLEAIATLAERPDLRRQIGLAGRRTVEEEYSMRRSAARFASVVRGLVEHKRTSQ
jgi:glycosyltransferase involved in cell wall biosynthesis